MYSVTGEYIDRVCERQVGYPSGIAISGDNVFVSDPKKKSYTAYSNSNSNFQNSYL